MAKESLRRLCWSVYTLDCEFPILLNLPGTITASEVCDLEMPCEDSFWEAPTAMYWTRLLGPIPEPLSRTFASAIGPFVVPFLANGNPNQDFNNPISHGLPHISLNPWSRMLVVLSIYVQIFDFSQELLLARNICGDNNQFESPNWSNSRNQETFLHDDYNLSTFSNAPSTPEEMRLRSRGSFDTASWNVWCNLATKKNQLSGEF